MEGMETSTLLLLIAPVFLVDLTLKILALVHLYRREQVRWGKPAWAAIIILVNLLGAPAYFLLTREDK
ncbi:MAG: PLD nuclease N-terminal domain-containing protein [Pseudomonadota bacterium]